MKIKYRRFDDNDYTEVECIEFDFRKIPFIDEDETVLDLFYRNGKLQSVKNVCEVYLEEI